MDVLCHQLRPNEGCNISRLISGYCTDHISCSPTSKSKMLGLSNGFPWDDVDRRFRELCDTDLPCSGDAADLAYEELPLFAHDYISSQFSDLDDLTCKDPFLLEWLSDTNLFADTPSSPTTPQTPPALNYRPPTPLTTSDFMPREFLLNDSQSDDESHSATYVAVPVGPYTPDNDHSYFAPKLPGVSDFSTDDTQKDSSDSESSGSDIDVETVSSECFSLYNGLKTKKRNAPTLRENVPPMKYRKVLQPSKARRRVVAKRHQTKTKAKRGRRPNKSLSSSPSSSRSNSDTEEPGKRKMHNSMERMRRQVQRSALHYLRDEIPELRFDVKAAKVKILKHAATYIRQLESQAEVLAERQKRLTDRNSILKKGLEMLLNDL